MLNTERLRIQNTRDSNENRPRAAWAFSPMTGSYKSENISVISVRKIIKVLTDTQAGVSNDNVLIVIRYSMSYFH